MTDKPKPKIEYDMPPGATELIGDEAAFREQFDKVLAALIASGKITVGDDDYDAPLMTMPISTIPVTLEITSISRGSSVLQGGCDDPEDEEEATDHE